jgi:hypothetical protein
MGGLVKPRNQNPSTFSGSSALSGKAGARGSRGPSARHLARRSCFCLRFGAEVLPFPSSLT